MNAFPVGFGIVAVEADAEGFFDVFVGGRVSVSLSGVNGDDVEGSRIRCVPFKSRILCQSDRLDLADQLAVLRGIHKSFRTEFFDQFLYLGCGQILHPGVAIAGRERSPKGVSSAHHVV